MLAAAPLPPERATRAAPRLLTVVLPVRDAEAYLAEQLAALGRQTYTGEWEVVVVDNGCTDGTLAVVDAWRARLPDVRVVAAPRRGLNRARNAGAAAARGELLAFCDADDVVCDGWLTALVDA